MRRRMKTVGSDRFRYQDMRIVDRQDRMTGIHLMKRRKRGGRQDTKTVGHRGMMIEGRQGRTPGVHRGRTTDLSLVRLDSMTCLQSC